MTRHFKSESDLGHRRSSQALRFIAVLATAALAFSTAAFAQSEEQVTAGLAAWRGSGCADCHGAFADGNREDDDWPIGADLRTTKLDATALRMMIRCGRAGTGMPSFDEGAYTVRACYGRAPGVAPNDLQPTPRPLSPNELDAVIAYLQARIIGRGRITRAECLAYYDEKQEWCEDYK